LAWSHGGRRAKPWVPGSISFHVSRARIDGFDPTAKPFVVDSPVYAVSKLLLAYPVTLRDYAYTSLGQLARTIVDVVEAAGMRAGWDTIEVVVRVSRTLGLSKDPPLLAAHKMPGWRRQAELLATYPVSKMWLYLHLARKQREIGVPLGYGARKRRAVNEALNMMPYEWHEYQAIRYRRKYRELLRMSHPKPVTPKLERLWGWLTGQRGPPTVRTVVADAILSGVLRGEKALAAAVKLGLPWEIVRSRIGRLDRIDPELVEEAAAKLMTSWDLAMQAKTIADLLGPEKVERIVWEKWLDMSAAAAARAAIGLYWTYEDLANLFAMIARERSRFFWKILEDLGVKYTGVTYLVDASASMMGPPITAAARILLSLGADEAYIFNNCVGVIPVRLDGLGDIIGLTNATRCGTPLYDAISRTLDNMDEGGLLVVLTDEQENASQITVDKLREKLDARDIWVATINVAPYTTSMIPKQPITRVVGLPGSSPNAVLASAVLLALSRMQSEGIADEEIIDIMKRFAEKYFRVGIVGE